MSATRQLPAGFLSAALAATEETASTTATTAPIVALKPISPLVKRRLTPDAGCRRASHAAAAPAAPRTRDAACRRGRSVEPSVRGVPRLGAAPRSIRPGHDRRLADARLGLGPAGRGRRRPTRGAGDPGPRRAAVERGRRRLGRGPPGAARLPGAGAPAGSHRAAPPARWRPPHSHRPAPLPPPDP